MSEILHHIDFAGRTRFQFYDAFFRPYHFDKYGPKTNFFHVFLWKNARGRTGHMIIPSWALLLGL